MSRHTVDLLSLTQVCNKQVKLEGMKVKGGQSAIEYKEADNKEVDRTLLHSPLSY